MLKIPNNLKNEIKNLIARYHPCPANSVDFLFEEGEIDAMQLGKFFDEASWNEILAGRQVSKDFYNFYRNEYEILKTNKVIKNFRIIRHD